MGSIGPETDPFVAIGFTPAFTEVVVGAIKRGRNGDGYTIDVRRPDGTVTPIERPMCEVINQVVNVASGEDAPLRVATLVAHILRKE